MQQVFWDYAAFDIIKDKKPLLVCDGAFDGFGLTLPFVYTRFGGFSSNPVYEQAKAGVEVLLENKCDFLLAIGGGSSIDVAKCIKYYSGIDVPIMAVPTTSGTGSEATHFAVIYKNGEKLSLADEKLLPDYVILQPDLLKTLPLYQKKCTMLDALSQAIESWWSRRAGQKSIEYAQEAIGLILTHMDSYLENEEEGNRQMLIASHLSGKAINLTTTTAPHAMSYGLSSMYGLPHGHAVALCLPKVWNYMKNFEDIAKALGVSDCEEAVAYWETLLQRLAIRAPEKAREEDLDLLTKTVNTQRLENNPFPLDKETIRLLYKSILEV